MHYKEAKGILSAQNGMNLYRGCLHGCIYCDSRSKCYGMEHAFEDVEVKINAPELLEAALKRKRQRCMIGTGSMCDPYLPIEEKEMLMRRCAELIERYGFGLTLITKSDLVLRDLDIFKRIQDRAKCVVQLTITTHDEALCRILEPEVCTSKRRVEVLHLLREAGIPTMVWLSPILPFINDTEENLRGILKSCFDAGVKGILDFGMGLTLREGNREYFYAQLDRHFPGMKARYIKSFGSSYACASPNAAALEGIFHAECEAHGVMHEPNAIFAYLHAYEDKRAGEQLSFF